jgi:hypothetical protein
MKMILILLLSLSYGFTLNAQVEISGTCFNSSVELTQNIDVNGKPSYIGVGEVLGVLNVDIQLIWDAVSGAWVLEGDGAVFYTASYDSPEPPSTSSTTWQAHDDFQCSNGSFSLNK